MVGVYLSRISSKSFDQLWRHSKKVLKCDNIFDAVLKLMLTCIPAYHAGGFLAAAKAKRTRLAMINTESSISFTLMMFSGQRLQKLCGPHFIPWEQRAQFQYIVHVSR